MLGQWICMEYLFEILTAKKLATLNKEELIERIQHHSITISHLRKQMQDLQRETERLRQELGYGETIQFAFVGELELRPRKKEAQERKAR